MIEDYKYFLPVIGIIIGWILTEVSFYFRKNRDDKRQIRSIVYGLFEMKFRLEQMVPILKDALESDSENLQNEIIVSALLKSEKEEFDTIIDQLKESLKIISSFNPFIALELNAALNQNLYFNEFVPIDDSYKMKDHIDRQLKTCNMFSKYLKKVIKKLLWQTDKISLIKFLYRDRKEKKSNTSYEGLFQK